MLRKCDGKVFKLLTKSTTYFFYFWRSSFWLNKLLPCSIKHIFSLFTFKIQLLIYTSCFGYVYSYLLIAFFNFQYLSPIQQSHMFSHMFFLTQTNSMRNYLISHMNNLFKKNLILFRLVEQNVPCREFHNNYEH